LQEKEFEVEKDKDHNDIESSLLRRLFLVLMTPNNKLTSKNEDYPGLYSSL